VDDKRHRKQAYALRETMMKMDPPLVLVAEDDADTRRLVATALRKDGWSVVEVTDGAELVEHVGGALLFGNLRGELDPVSLVVSDIRMPGPNGLEVLAELRRADIAVGFILMTAYADAEVRATAERLGADALIAKPFEVDELRALVRSVLTTAGVVPAVDMVS
jgi:CheY-like chemotaxis protein